MTVEPLRSLQRAQPFRPFILRLFDETSMAVQHPEHMRITPGGQTLVVVTSDDAVRIIDPAHVVSICVDKAKSTRRPARQRNAWRTTQGPGPTG